MTLHDLLDLAEFGDHLHVKNANDGALTCSIAGPVLATGHDRAVGIDTLDGAPHVVRTPRGAIHGRIVYASLKRGPQVLGTFREDRS